MDTDAANRRAWQIARMRDENPDIWLVIDGFCTRGAGLDACMDALACPHGSCKRCGYDLYGNVNGVCPECGREIAFSQKERTLRSIQIMRKMRSDHPDLNAGLDEQLKQERLERQAAERRRRREQALRSYLKWRRELAARSPTGT